MLYALARVEITDDSETIEVFYTATNSSATENDIEKWQDDDEKTNGVKKKRGKKPKSVTEDFEETVWKPFCQVVFDQLSKCGGWAMINVEYLDSKTGNWNNKSVQILYSDDSELGIKKKFLLGACNNNVAGVSGGFKNIQVNSAGDLDDLEEIISKMNR